MFLISARSLWGCRRTNGNDRNKSLQTWTIVLIADVTFRRLKRTQITSRQRKKPLLGAILRIKPTSDHRQEWWVCCDSRRISAVCFPPQRCLDIKKFYRNLKKYHKFYWQLPSQKSRLRGLEFWYCAAKLFLGELFWGRKTLLSWRLFRSIFSVLSEMNKGCSWEYRAGLQKV